MTSRNAQQITRDSMEKHTVEFLRTAGGTRPDLRVVNLDGSYCVVKDFRGSDFLFRLLIGPLLIGREARALSCLRGVEGIPQLIRRIDRYAIAIEHVDAPALAYVSESPGQEFFARLQSILNDVHARGVVHCDLRSSGNVLVGSDGSPWIVDFAASITRGRGWNPFVNFLIRQFTEADDHAVLILKNKHAPHLLTEDERTRLETPLPFERVAIAIGWGVRNLTRRVLTRKQAADGAKSVDKDAPS